MNMPESHYTNFLISVQFSRNFTPETMHGKKELCLDFLHDVGILALKSGMRLHGTYSIVDGLNDCHAHFGLSWLPLFKNKNRSSQKKKKRINRHPVIAMLENNNFYVDNPNQAIKVVTVNKKFVTDYIIEQPKVGQFTQFSDFYIHDDFVPSASERKIDSYCNAKQFPPFQNIALIPHNPRHYFLSRTFIFQLLLIMATIALLF